MVEDHPILNHGRYGRGWKQASPCMPTHGFCKVPGDGWEQYIKSKSLTHFQDW